MTSTSVARRVFAALALLILPILLGACASAQLRTFYDQDGKRLYFKRRAVHSAVDYVHRFSDRAYKPCKKLRHSSLSFDQRVALSDLGKPDFLRIPFRSQYGERVSEWVYTDRARVLQFVGGDIVWDGPLTDMEQILLQRGYPRYYLAAHEEDGPVRETYVYRSPLGKLIQIYSFADGTLTSETE